VQVAYDGAEAIELGARAKPEIALLDIGMPKYDGYEVAERLRNAPGGADIVLVALTGWGQEGDKSRAIEAGFDHHLTKPVAPQRLTELLRQPFSAS